MDTKPFDQPVALRIDGKDVDVGNVQQAVTLLSDVGWPGPRDDLHADALETCLKVLDGHRSTQDGRQRLVEAALAAGVHAGPVR